MALFESGSAALNSVIIYILFMFFIYISQPTTFFIENTYQLKQFGIRERNKTLLTLHIFSILFCVIIYMFFSILESLCYRSSL
jgi:hypothetical protein